MQSVFLAADVSQLTLLTRNVFLISTIRHFHVISTSCPSPLLDGHLFGGHVVRQQVSRLCGGQEISRMDTVPAKVLVVLQGQRLGLDQRLGEGLRFGWCLWRHLGFWLRLGNSLRIWLGESLDEFLRFGLGLWGLSEWLGVRGWRLGLGVRWRF